MAAAFPRNTHRVQSKSTTVAGGTWPTVGEHVTAAHRRSASNEVPDPDWLPWPPTAQTTGLPLPRNERTPYRVWEVLELRARCVRWSRIAARLDLPESVLRGWIHRLATRQRRP